jgi:hypothetical protein
LDPVDLKETQREGEREKCKRKKSGSYFFKKRVHYNKGIGL